MKTNDEIRRENLAVLVQRAGSQIEVARRLGKDKNQINQWLGKGSSREISSESARAIETAFNTGRGWMDHDHSESQDSGLDVDKLSTTIKFLEDLFGARKVPFLASKRTGFIVAVYYELLRTGTENVVALTDKFGPLIGGNDNERQGQTGSISENDRKRVGRGTGKT